MIIGNFIRAMRLYYRQIFFKCWGIGKLLALSKAISFWIKNHKSVQFLNRNEMFHASLNEAPKEGLILEFGVGSGDTIKIISKIVPERIVYGFDSFFSGLPNSNRPFVKGQFRQTTLPTVPSNVKLVVGLFQDTLDDFLEKHTTNIAFIHMDADLYSSTKYLLLTLMKHKRIVPGMMIQFDQFISINYPEAWTKGEFGAFNDFVENFGVSYEYTKISYAIASIRILEIKGVK